MNIKEDVKLYKVDFTGVDPFNSIHREYMSRTPGDNGDIQIPRHAPFYIKSVKLYTISGEPLVEGTDFEFYGILGKLTAYTAKPVGLFIRLLNSDLTEWFIDYQVVGNFNKITNEILNLLQSAYTDDRKIKWENITNKPTWFVPKLHKHDLTYEVYGFTDLAAQIIRIAEIRATVSRPESVTLEVIQERITYYIEGFRKVIRDIVDSHNSGKVNNHGVWKDAIGLDLVDDFPVATIEQAIEGLRTDLHLTPAVAVAAVQQASGKNNKLFPSGSLPILRYGTDTFIPPTITGSFEGMGGWGNRSGAIVESDGTLLILHRRYNGNTEGLYFTRSINYTNKNPDYEFTSYRYRHPTAEAAGVELTHIINGSNKYMMVVGNLKKNIWYWVATNGTFNPDRHILNRITGDWVTFMGEWGNKATTFLDQAINDCTLLAGPDYMTRAVILQAYNQDMMKKYRPTWVGNVDVPPVPRHFDGFAFYQMVSGNSKFASSKVNFNHPKFGNFNDNVFTPFVWDKTPDKVPGKNYNTIKSYHFEFKEPIELIWTYRALHASSGKINNDITAFRMEFMILTVSMKGTRTTRRVPYRANLTYGLSGSTPTVQVVPATGSDKLYTWDPDDPYGEVTQDQKDANKYVWVTATPETEDIVGSVDLGNGLGIFIGGSANWTYPNTFSLSGQTYFKSPEAIVTPPPYNVNEEWRTFSYINKTMYEYNPIGLGMLFTSPNHICTDTDDFTTGAVMARQVGPNGTEWVVRPLDFIDSNWLHKDAPNVMTMGGKQVKHYPLTSRAYKTNIGPQVSLAQPIQPQWASGQAKERYKRLFGADAWSNITGKAILNSDEFGVIYVGSPPNGDGLYIKENTIKLVNDIVTFTPTKVINVKPAIMSSIKTLLGPYNITEEWLGATWNIGRIVTAEGKWLETFTAWQIINRKCNVAFFTCEIVGKGAPVNKDGYQYWADATITRVSNVYTFETGDTTVQDKWEGPCFISGTHFHTPSTISVPHNGTPMGATEQDRTAMLVIARSMCRYTDIFNRRFISPLIKLKGDGTLPDARQVSDVYSTDNGPDNGWFSTPLYGLGNGFTGVNLMEGAGIVANGFVSGPKPEDLFSYISRWEFDPDATVMGMNNLLVSQYTVYFNKADNVIIAGKSYSIDSTFIDIKTIDPSPANKTFYVYVYFTNGLASYEITQNVHPESSTRSMIAIVKCGATQIDTIEPFNRFSMDGAIVSARRHGSAILGASGSIFEIGDTSKIMLDSDYIP